MARYTLRSTSMSVARPVAPFSRIAFASSHVLVDAVADARTNGRPNVNWDATLSVAGDFGIRGAMWQKSWTRLNGLHLQFTMPTGLQIAHSALHYAEDFCLADQVALLLDPAFAKHKIEAHLTTHRICPK